MSDTDSQLRNFLSRKLKAEITQHFRTRSSNPVEVTISEEELATLVDVEISTVDRGTEPNSSLRYVIIKGRGSYEIKVGIKMQRGAKARRTGVGGGIAGFFGGGGAGAGIGALIGIIGGPIGVGIGMAIGAGVGAAVGTVSGAVGGGAAGTKFDLHSGNAQCKIKDILPGMGRVVSADNEDCLRVKITY
jgi:hypothetical protein